jgi:shikimate dehydrogenase
MRLYGLIGYPLSHSFSKKYFTEKFEKENLADCRYENFPIRYIENLAEVLKQNPELQGLNVTIPYKEQAIPYLHEVSDVVKKTGACNCIKIKAGKLYGFNTDVIGIEKSLTGLIKPGGKHALILGTGGAAKAVAYVLEKLGIQYRFVSRQASKNVYGYNELTDSVIASNSIIINTTPLGMYPAVNEAPSINYNAITDNHFLFDLIYNPEKTMFLEQGEKRGAAIKNGYEMLLLQAEESWKIWSDPLL